LCGRILVPPGMFLPRAAKVGKRNKRFKRLSMMLLPDAFPLCSARLKVLHWNKPPKFSRQRCRMAHFLPVFPAMTTSSQRLSKSCQKILDLGYIAGKHVNLYGEHFEIASDPFVDDDWVAIRVMSENDPTIRTIRLPVSILVGLTDLLPKLGS